MRALRLTRPAMIVVFAASLLAASGRAEDAPKPASSLTLGAVTVTPSTPAADTLCELRVEIVNKGDRIASQLGFAVKVNGQELPVYRNQLFMQRLDPGKTSTVRLYNFWTSESTRPAPKDGKYRVEVTMREAKWYEIASQDGVEDWTPLSAVSGLPLTATVTVGK